MSDRAIARLITWLSVTAGAIATFCLLFFLRQDFSLVGWMNALFYCGGIVVLLGLLVLVAHFGAFDFFVYGVRDVFFHMNPNPEKKKPYADYVDYSEKKKELRRRRGLDAIWPFLIIGIVIFIASVVLRIIYGQQTGLGI